MVSGKDTIRKEEGREGRQKVKEDCCGLFGKCCNNAATSSRRSHYMDTAKLSHYILRKAGDQEELSNIIMLTLT